MLTHKMKSLLIRAYFFTHLSTKMITQIQIR